MPDKVDVSIPFATGLQDKASPIWLDAGGATTVQNGIFVKANQIQKRPGGAALGKTEGGTTVGAPNVTVCKKLAAYRNELLLFDGQYVRSYHALRNTWIAKDEISPCVATRETVAQTSTGVFDGDVCELGGYRVFVWSDTSGGYGSLYFAVQEIASGQVISNGYVGGTSATASKPRLVALPGQNVIVLVHQRSSDNALCGRVMSVAAVPTWGGQSVIIAGAGVRGANCAWDAAYVTGSSLFILAYENNAGVIKLSQVTSALALVTTGTCTDATTNYTAIGIRGDVSSGLVWMGFSSNGGQAVKAATYAYPAMTESVAPFSVQAAAGPTWGHVVALEQLDSTHAIIAFGSVTSYQWAVISSAGAITTGKKTGWQQELLSRPILVASLDSVYGVRAYALVAKSTNAGQVTQFVVELDVRNAPGSFGAHPVATLSPRFAQSGAYVPRSDSTLSNGTILGNPAATTFGLFGTVAENLNGVTAVSSVTVDFNHPGAYTCTELGGSLYISAGVPCVYDGARCIEIGALQVNEAASLTPIAGGSLAATQTYSYIFVPEWRDAKGQRHQGQPSIPQTATTTGVNKQITIVVNQAHLTNQFFPYFVPNVAVPYIVPYRTVFDGATMGTVYHRIISDMPAPYAGSFNPSNTTFTFTDTGAGTFSDASAATAEQLYTTGGVVESDCPPSFTTLCQHRGRIFGVADDQRTIWYSTEYRPGAPVRFYDGFTLSVEDGGPITAIASLEGYLVVFKADAIYYFTGEGPNILGEQGSFQGPVRLPVDGGCINPRSLILTPLGLVFRTRNGIGLLDRGLGFRNDFGDAVENTIGQTSAAPIVSVVQHPTRPEYWFEVAASASASEVLGKSAVFNTRFGAWSVMSRYDTDKSRAGALMNSGAVVAGTYYYSTPFGQVYSEYPLLPASTTGQFKDAGNYITLTVESAWLKPSLAEGANKIGGFGRVWKALFLEEWRDYHSVTIETAYDYNTSYTDTFTFTAGYHTSALYEELEVNMSRPLCESIRFRFSDAEYGGNPSNTGQGGVLVGITAEVGTYPGTNRKGSGRRK